MIKGAASVVKSHYPVAHVRIDVLDVVHRRVYQLALLAILLHQKSFVLHKLV